MVEQLNNYDDDFFDFPAIEEVNDNEDDDFIAKGLTLKQALQEENILLANEIVLDIIDSIDTEKEND